MRKGFRNYGAAGGLGDSLSRLAAIKDDDGSGSEGSTLASYCYNGLGRLVVEDFQQPDVRLDYWRDADGTETAGTYKGLGRFGRIGRQAWRNYDAPALRERLEYGYDCNSNRTYRQNVLAGAADKKLDELYAHDALDRLVEFKRGTLNRGKPVGWVACGNPPTPASRRVRAV